MREHPASHTASRDPEARLSRGIVSDCATRHDARASLREFIMAVYNAGKDRRHDTARSSHDGSRRAHDRGLVGVGVVLASQVNRPYPGFFFSPDYRVFPVTPSRRGGSARRRPRRQRRRQLAADAHGARGRRGRPARYEMERTGRRFVVDLAPQVFTWSDLINHFAGYFAVSVVMLAVGLLVFAQNPSATPNRNFLIYMCLWAVSKWRCRRPCSARESTPPFS